MPSDHLTITRASDPAPGVSERVSTTHTQYQVGVDLGTTHTVAAVQPLDAGRVLPARLAELGTGRVAAPTAVYVDPDGGLRFGEAAVQAGGHDPTRLVRDFRRRVGDPTPVIVAGQPWKPEELTARMVRWAVDRIAPEYGDLPERVVVTHPVSWGGHTTGLLRGALSAQGLDAVLLAEPHAAVIQAVTARGLPPGSMLAVYDLGGGSLDAAVVRTSADGTHEILGPVERHDRLGGADFDDVVFEHVRTAVPGLFDAVDETDPADLAAVARVRHACTAAKERLSSDTEASIPVVLAGRETTVRLHRSEFEHLVRPLVEESVTTFERTVRAAGLAPRDLTELLLVGGSSRIPLVSQLLSERLDRPVVVDRDPTSLVARGAAIAPAPGPAQAPAHALAIPAQSGKDDSTDTVPGMAAVPPARPERPLTAADPGWVAPTVDPDARSTGWTVAGFIVLGATMAVVAMVSIAACVLLAYPTPDVGVDGPAAARPDGPSVATGPADPTDAQPNPVAKIRSNTGDPAASAAGTSAPVRPVAATPSAAPPSASSRTAPATTTSAKPVEPVEPVEPTSSAGPVTPSSNPATSTTADPVPPPAPDPVKPPDPVPPATVAPAASSAGPA